MANEAINGPNPFLSREHLGTAKTFNVGMITKPAAFKLFQSRMNNSKEGNYAKKLKEM